MALLRVEQLQKEFYTRGGLFNLQRRVVTRVIEDATFEVSKGEIVAIVGGAGSGKTVLARTMAMLIKPSGGGVYFEDRNLANLRESALRPIRRRLQFLFGDPRQSLNPKHLINQTLLEPLQAQQIGDAAQRQMIMHQALRQVGLNVQLMDKPISALSVGERQRVALARALTLQPKLIICDDPAKVLPQGIAESFFRLMGDLRRRQGIAFIWLVSEEQPALQFADKTARLQEKRLGPLAPVVRPS